MAHMGRPPPSSSGLGYQVLILETGVRVPVGALLNPCRGRGFSLGAVLSPDFCPAARHRLKNFGNTLSPLLRCQPTLTRLGFRPFTLLTMLDPHHTPLFVHAPILSTNSL